MGVTNEQPSSTSTPKKPAPELPSELELQSTTEDSDPQGKPSAVAAPIASGITPTGRAGLTREGIDVAALPRLHLEGIGPRSPMFQAVLRQSALNKVFRHAHSAGEGEVFGILVGNLYKDIKGPFLYVEDAIELPVASTDDPIPADVWADLQQRIARDFPKQTCAGWYHARFGRGVLLSDVDEHLRSNLFTQPGQVGLMYDSKTGEEGLYSWQISRSKKLVGLVVADQANQKKKLKAQSRSAADEPVRTKRPGALPSRVAKRMLVTATCCAFCAGGVFAAIKTNRLHIPAGLFSPSRATASPTLPPTHAPAPALAPKIFAPAPAPAAPAVETTPAPYVPAVSQPSAAKPVIQVQVSDLPTAPPVLTPVPAPATPAPTTPAPADDAAPATPAPAAETPAAPATPAAIPDTVAVPAAPAATDSPAPASIPDTTLVQPAPADTTTAKPDGAAHTDATTAAPAFDPAVPSIDAAAQRHTILNEDTPPVAVATPTLALPLPPPSLVAPVAAVPSHPATMPTPMLFVAPLLPTTMPAVSIPATSPTTAPVHTASAGH